MSLHIDPSLQRLLYETRDQDPVLTRAPGPREKPALSQTLLSLSVAITTGHEWEGKGEMGYRNLRHLAPLVQRDVNRLAVGVDAS